ncbi:cation:proton antiporter [Corynebacterium variabile]|uniref:cation:proton antiporter n=1 Tax=Corynebacterium variabile TaxID=1727 RepID=UPI0028A993B8|nr:cation:proton antiporter [Corynebacterium variabile]
MTDTHISFAWIAAAGLLAPVLSFATSKKVPAVVFLIILGVLIGPYGLELTTDSEAIDLVRELGLGMLFLLAGMELAPSDLKGREGRNAILTWIICALLAFGATMALTGGETGTATVLAIALTSTALGTLLPIIRQQGLAGTPVGNSVMIHGAVGELAPVMAMALLLSARTTWATAVILVILIARGLPVLLRELGGHTGSSLQGWREKLQLSLYAATGLPIIVAVTEVATTSGLLAEEEASLLVAAGALTVAIFPTVADAVGPTKRAVH